MIRSGLVSITFRQLSPAEIAALAAQAGLEAIERGGDVEEARAVRRTTEDAGLQVAAYGAYYRVGHEEPCPFAEVLETAVALTRGLAQGAPLVVAIGPDVGTADSSRSLEVPGCSVPMSSEHHHNGGP
jgi:3-dehydroshikimate dehydratase